MASKTRGAAGRRRARAGPREATAADVYQDLLSEATASAYDTDQRPLKRPKTWRDLPSSSPLPITSDHENASPDAPTKQVAFRDSDSEEDSDIDFEDVDLGQEQITSSPPPADADLGDISVVLGGGEEAKRRLSTSKRRPTTAIEKKRRLDTHKVHVMSLLMHGYARSKQCEVPEVRSALAPLLSKKTKSYLNPISSESQFQRSRSFMDGLNQAVDMWKVRYTITQKGLRRPRWADDLNDLAKLVYDEDYLDNTDFVKSATTLEGSRDIGAQLFCALLRSAGVDARLVFSLQPLFFNAVPPAATTQPSKPTVYYPAVDPDANGDTGDESTASDASARSLAGGPRRIKRFGHSRSGSGTRMDLGKSPPMPVRRRIVETPYPVFWVEGFNEAHQKWIPVDPLVTYSINKTAAFEPPQGSATSMSYVIAFEEDGSVRDVTRRYAKAYNGKTRRNRVETTKGGEKWWKHVLKIFDNGLIADRDQLEEAELAQKEASEPIPRGVQDFKGHPYYALERHLKQNEVIHPRREVGKFTPGSRHNASASEAIYRRRDVQNVMSADKWFRRGLEIKSGEQPLKFAARRTRRRLFDDLDDITAQDEEIATALYAEFQTRLYTPPPIAYGRVPKNAFQNLDVYVPSMIPAGGVHIRIPEAAKAARLLGIDYADAVTGFEFRGRQGTAITSGVVVAEEFEEAVVAVLEGIWEMSDEMEASKRTRAALRLWKKFLIGLRIRERVMGGEREQDELADEEMQDTDDDEMEEEYFGHDEGGFFPDQDQEEIAVPTSIRAQKGFPSLDGTSEEVLESQDVAASHVGVRRTVPSSAIVYPPGATQSRFEGGLLDAQKATSAATEHIKTKSEEPGQPGGFLNDAAEYDEMMDQPAELDNMGGGFLPEDEEDASGSLQDELADGESRLELSAAQAHARGMTVAEQPDMRIVEENSLLAAEHSDVGSMLSHDPEDDDAEPEWLADETTL